jgi:hypothetical protein
MLVLYTALQDTLLKENLRHNFFHVQVGKIIAKEPLLAIRQDTTPFIRPSYSSFTSDVITHLSSLTYNNFIVL